MINKMDKVLSEVIEELGHNRISAKEMFDKYTKSKTFSNIVVQNYNKIKTRILECPYGSVHIFQTDLCSEGRPYGCVDQLREMVLNLLKEDGFHIESIQIPLGPSNTSPGYFIAWDERSEYQKMRALIEKSSTSRCSSSTQN